MAEIDTLIVTKIETEPTKLWKPKFTVLFPDTVRRCRINGVDVPSGYEWFGPQTFATREETDAFGREQENAINAGLIEQGFSISHVAYVGPFPADE